MRCSDAQTDAAAAIVFRPRSSLKEPFNVIEDEPEWRLQPGSRAVVSSGPRVIATRWRSREQRMREVSAETADDCYIVKIVLRSMSFRLSLSGRTVQDGVAMPGMLHVTEP